MEFTDYIFFLKNLISYYEFFNIFYAIILISGLYQIGEIIFKIKILNNIFSKISEIKYLKIFISTNLILLIFYPLILYFNQINFITLLSVSIFSFGIYKIITKLKKKIYLSYLKPKNISLGFNVIYFDKYLVLSVICLLFILSLSPNTHGDTLGYHFVIAEKLMISGRYHYDLTHFHSLLVGSGEILIAIGLFFGSEQFGNLVQFSGLISLFGVIKNIKNKDNFFYFLLILTSPIILFLSSTAKPQLFHICSSSIIFSLYFLTNSNSISLKEKNWKMAISILILIVSVTAKFNFLLSSILLGSFIIYKSYKDKNIWNLIFILILFFLVFYFPIIFWKKNYFGGNILQYLFSPLPLHIIGLEEFQQYLLRYGRQNNPLQIIFYTNAKQFTQSIGISILYLFLINFKNSKSLVVFILSFIYFFVQYFYGQFIGRSFLEPLIWILLICARYGVSYRIKFYEYMGRIQAFLVIGSLIFGIYSLFPGSLTSSLKHKTLGQSANGYGLFTWANQKLNKEDVVFSIHRSTYLGESNYVATDFIPFVDFTSKNSQIYEKIINKKNPTYLLTWGYPNEEPEVREFKNCIEKLLYYQKDIGRFETRNPFNRGNKYDGYIFKLKQNVVPRCFERNN